MDKVSLWWPSPNPSWPCPQQMVISKCLYISELLRSCRMGLRLWKQTGTDSKCSWEQCLWTVKWGCQSSPGNMPRYSLLDLCVQQLSSPIKAASWSWNFGPAFYHFKCTWGVMRVCPPSLQLLHRRRLIAMCVVMSCEKVLQKYGVQGPMLCGSWSARLCLVTCFHGENLKA